MLWFGGEKSSGVADVAKMRGKRHANVREDNIHGSDREMRERVNSHR